MRPVLLLVIALATLAACSRVNIENMEAVQAAMVEYLEARQDTMGLDPDSMDIVVDAVAFERDTAHASVSFLIKGTTEGMLGMNYTLVREGDKWVVESRQDEAVAPHGFEGALEEDAVDPSILLPEGHVPLEAEGAAPEGATAGAQ